LRHQGVTDPTYMVEFHGKLAYCFLCIVMTGFGMPLALHIEPQWWPHSGTQPDALVWLYLCDPAQFSARLGPQRALTTCRSRLAATGLFWMRGTVPGRASAVKDTLPCRIFSRYQVINDSYKARCAEAHASR